MQKPRIYMDTELVDKETLFIKGDNFHYLTHVLRLKEDSIFNVFDGKSKEIKAKILQIDKNSLVAEIIEKVEKVLQSKISIDIAQAIPKKDKMDLIVEKVTELGARSIFPFISERTIPKLNNDKENKRITRWQKIAKSAAIQSKRNNIPNIMNITSLDNLKEIFNNYDLIIIPWEEEKIISLKSIFKQKKDVKNIMIVIGPEGGFSDEEINDLKKTHVKVVSLGRRILRTETVALAMLSIINYELGLMDYEG